MSNVYLPIWPGSSSFTSGMTPFGYYDNDPSFQSDIESTTEWCARRFGYGLSDVELQDRHFFAAFEEAVNEYGYMINTFAARDNLINLLGINTGSSSTNLAQTYIPTSFSSIFEISKEYGNPIGSGGNQTWYTGSINLIADKQVYDLHTDTIVETGSLSTDKFTIRKIFHNDSPALTRYLDPTLGTSYLTQQFGWGSFNISGQFLVMPIHYDILRIQAIELNDQIRKSSYSFQITNNRLRIFPIPTESQKLIFFYTLESQKSFDGSNNSLSDKSKISDMSNVPYLNLKYSNINSIGRNWIRKYTLAICKEILGYIRGKYASIPIPDGEVTLNAADLLSAAKEEKDALTIELKEILDQSSKQSQLERKAAESENLNNQLSWFPTKIYVR